MCTHQNNIPWSLVIQFVSQCQPTAPFVCLFLINKSCPSLDGRASVSLLFVSVGTLSFTLAERAWRKINCASVSSQPSFLLTYFSIPNSRPYLGLGWSGKGLLRYRLARDATQNLEREIPFCFSLSASRCSSIVVAFPPSEALRVFFSVTTCQCYNEKMVAWLQEGEWVVLVVFFHVFGL